MLISDGIFGVLSKGPILAALVLGCVVTSLGCLCGILVEELSGCNSLAFEDETATTSGVPIEVFDDS